VNTNCKTGNEKRTIIRHGFTLSEVMVAMSIFALVVASSVPVLILCQRTWTRTSSQLTATQKASIALERMVYGVGDQYGLRSATAASIVVTPNGTNWTVTYTDIVGNASAFAYNSSNKMISYSGMHTIAVGTNGLLNTNGWVKIGTNITAATVQNSALGMTITVTAAVTNGKYSASTTMSTYVSYRN
jgi:prepilin-type N-terminal cleavage/methylation domain-containing protein